MGQEALLHRWEGRPTELRGLLELQDLDSKYRSQLAIITVLKSLWHVLILTLNAIYPRGHKGRITAQLINWEVQLMAVVRLKLVEASASIPDSASSSLLILWAKSLGFRYILFEHKLFSEGSGNSSAWVWPRITPILKAPTLYGSFFPNIFNLIHVVTFVP